MLITLLTDFGTTDTYIGQMKGVIAAIAPEARVIDLTHHVPPQDITSGAVALDSAVDVFPAGTIHVAVVDPGVGSARRPIAARSDAFLWVGPDNGLFTAAWKRYPPRHIVALTEPAYHRPEVSATFHGRDVFAPAAAHLAAGVKLDELGETIDDPVRLELPEPERTADTVKLRVLTIDHFGNLVTNMTARHLTRYSDLPRATVTAGRITAHGVHRTFADVPEHEPVAYIGSSGRLEIAVRNGSAAATAGVHPGDPVWFFPAR
ncbi:MAG: SAM hydrolase/SAM-dependent halogenase family protein [Phycisphaeraceae bacterium]